MFSWQHAESGSDLQQRGEELPRGGQQAAPGQPGSQPAGQPALVGPTRLPALGGGHGDWRSARHQAVQVTLCTMYSALALKVWRHEKVC